MHRPGAYITVTGRSIESLERTHSMANATPDYMADTPVRPRALSAFSWDDMTDEDARILKQYVPPSELADQYVNRNFDGILDFNILAYAMDNRLNVMIEGPTSSAKTTLLRAFAAQHGLPFFARPVSGHIDITKIEGNWRPDPELTAVWADAPEPRMFRSGGVWDIDEFNMMGGETSARLHECLGPQRCMTMGEYDGTVIKAHPALLIGATMNLGYQGTQRLNEAVQGRFGIQLHMPYHRETELEVVPVPALVDFAWRVRELDEVRTPFGTNALQQFVGFATGFGMDFAKARMLSRFRDSERSGVARAFEAVAVAIEDDIATYMDDLDSEEG